MGRLVLQRWIAFALILCVACSRESPVILVPGAAFEQSIQLSTAQGERARVRVDQPLVLHAQRRTGPWVPAPGGSLPPGSCWLEAPPPELEPEVADNLRWVVEPPHTARFNVDYRLDRTREVRFSEPGLYELTASSAVWCGPPYGGNTLTVEVVAE